MRHPLASRALCAAYSEVIATVVVASGPAPVVTRDQKEIHTMLHYAVVFFIIALISAVLGFGGIAAGAAGIAKILFGVFLVMAIASFLFGLSRRQ
jgi:uncharacterized membrane protein YtjA (UPF0391 family)